MTAVITVAARRDAAALKHEVLRRIACGGLLIYETELRYQLRCHPTGSDAEPSSSKDSDRLPHVLNELKQQGLIESETHYRLTARERELPAADRPAPRSISTIPWGTG